MNPKDLVGRIETHETWGHLDREGNVFYFTGQDDADEQARLMAETDGGIAFRCTIRMEVIAVEQD